jgi:hypothetical protein
MGQNSGGNCQKKRKPMVGFGEFDSDLRAHERRTIQEMLQR